jgi:hypothetical protein
MFDELLDNLTDHDRARHRTGSSSILGRISQILGGENDADHQEGRRPRDRERRHDDFDDEENDDRWDQRRNRSRRDFDLEFGD